MDRLAQSDVRDALRAAEMAQDTELLAGVEAVTVRVIDPARIDAAVAALDGVAYPADGYETGLVVRRLDDGVLELGFSEMGLREIRERAVSITVDIMQRRLDELGVADAAVFRNQPDQVVVQLPGDTPLAGLVEAIAKPGQLGFHTVVASAGSGAPGPGEIELTHIDGSAWIVESQPVLTGADVIDAALGFHPSHGVPVVNFRFDARGAAIFGDYTAANVGELFAIVVDGEIVSVPMINGPIPGGAGFVEGAFTVEEAEALALSLRTGAAPARLDLIAESRFDIPACPKLYRLIGACPEEQD